MNWNDEDHHDEDASPIQTSRYRWLTPKDADDYSTKIISHIISLLEMYPEMDATIMIAVINALSYQVDSKERYDEAIKDIDDFTSQQMLKNIPASKIAGTA